MLGESIPQSLTLGNTTWHVLESSVGIITLLFAVTQVETGIVYQVEMTIDAFGVERAGLTPEQIKESVFWPVLEHFHLADE